MNDPELIAMSTITEALNPLDESAQVRVVRWVVDKLKLPGQKPSALNESSSVQTDLDESDLPMLFSTAQPRNESEKVLVVAYWMQECKGQSEFDSQPLNAQLKNLGHGIGNITRALKYLIDQKPQLVIQCRKSGTTKQARKRFKLTMAGIQKTRKLISKSSSDEETEK